MDDRKGDSVSREIKEQPLTTTTNGQNGQMNYSSWTILGYELSREIPVSRGLSRKELTYYLPMQMRHKRVSKHSKHRQTYEVPLIPGILFIRGIDTWHKAVEIQYTEDSPMTNAQGDILRVPEGQMLAFQSAVAEMNAEALRRARANQPEKKRKPIRIKLAPENEKVIMQQLFGAVEEVA